MHLILIMLPLFFKIIFGRKAIGEDIKWSFGTICAISFFGQIHYAESLLNESVAKGFLVKKEN